MTARDGAPLLRQTPGYHRFTGTRVHVPDENWLPVWVFGESSIETRDRQTNRSS